MVSVIWNLKTVTFMKVNLRMDFSKAMEDFSVGKIEKLSMRVCFKMVKNVAKES